MARKYLFPATVVAVVMSFAGVTPAAAQEPTVGMPAPAAAYGSLVTAMTHAHLQYEAFAETDLETAQIALINIADVVPAGDLQTFESLVAQHQEGILHLRGSLAAHEGLSERIGPFLVAADIEEEPEVFMERVVAIEVDREGNAIAVYYDGR